MFSAAATSAHASKQKLPAEALPGEYIIAYAKQIESCPRAFAELWALREALTYEDDTTVVGTIGKRCNRELPESALACFDLLSRVKDHAEKKAKCTKLVYTVEFSPEGNVSDFKPPPSSHPALMYIFNSPETLPCRFIVRNHTKANKWIITARSGDVLEYKCSFAHDLFQIQCRTDPDCCNGRRISITVTVV